MSTARTDDIPLDDGTASRLLSTAVANVRRDHPVLWSHVVSDDARLVPQRVLHPVFAGAFDWHSCVHQTWLAVRLLRLRPHLPGADEARRALDGLITAEGCRAEADFFGGPSGAFWERPYGWAWLLALDAELRTWAATPRPPHGQPPPDRPSPDQPPPDRPPHADRPRAPHAGGPPTPPDGDASPASSVQRPAQPSTASSSGPSAVPPHVRSPNPPAAPSDPAAGSGPAAGSPAPPPANPAAPPPAPLPDPTTRRPSAPSALQRQASDQSVCRWAANLRPLSAVLRDRYLEWASAARLPVRAGTHANTAFATGLVLDAAEAVGDGELARVCAEAAARWHLDDRAYGGFEPDAADFLSPALTEADLMRRVLSPGDFPVWFERFLPDLDDARWKSLREPVPVDHPDDPYGSHLAGLALSRACHWRSIADALPPDHRYADLSRAAAAAHREAGLRHVFGHGYYAEHWLGTFAAYLSVGAF
ncbi:DUF2891 family protein [Saccharothrix australiensis]|nr:DUF2891 family protein [Saccharothrix australiensis]